MTLGGRVYPAMEDARTRHVIAMGARRLSDGVFDKGLLWFMFSGAIGSRASSFAIWSYLGYESTLMFWEMENSLPPLFCLGGEFTAVSGIGSIPLVGFVP
ncbi:hypothetical protein U1Q18_037798 [Sarracenia purpurea var. burkii]